MKNDFRSPTTAHDIVADNTVPASPPVMATAAVSDATDSTVRTGVLHVCLAADFSDGAVEVSMFIGGFLKTLPSFYHFSRGVQVFV